MSEKSEKAEVKSEKSESALEQGTMLFHNETTGEKITIRVELLDQERLAVDTEFDPSLKKDNYSGLMANCALLVLDYLKDL